MLVTALVIVSPDATAIYIVPEANVGADTVRLLRIAAGHVAGDATNPPDVADAINTILELIARPWARYKISGGSFEDNDDGVVRVVVTGYRQAASVA
jgi:hypothetical protein